MYKNYNWKHNKTCERNTETSSTGEKWEIGNANVPDLKYQK